MDRQFLVRGPYCGLDLVHRQLKKRQGGAQLEDSLLLFGNEVGEPLALDVCFTQSLLRSVLDYLGDGIGSARASNFELDTEPIRVYRSDAQAQTNRDCLVRETFHAQLDD